jgi:hypothetical protein
MTLLIRKWAIFMWCWQMVTVMCIMVPHGTTWAKFKVPQVQPDLLEQLALQEPLGHKAFREQPVHKALQAILEPLDPQVPLATLVQLDHRAHKVPQDLLASKVTLAIQDH